LPTKPEIKARPQIRVSPSVTGLITPKSSLPSLCLIKQLFDDWDVKRNANSENEQVEQSAIEVHYIHKGDSAENGVQGITAVIQERSQRR